MCICICIYMNVCKYEIMKACELAQDCQGNMYIHFVTPND